MTDVLTPEVHAKLQQVSTATLTTQLFKRGLRNCFIQGVRKLSACTKTMVGAAYTLRYIPAREDLDHLGVFEGRQHPQRRAIEEIPSGQVLVMDCRKDASVASAGSILLARLLVRGAAGLVTDGGLRDSPEIAQLDLPVYFAAPAAPMNLIKHHAVALNEPIACGDVAVYPGDILVGDDEGVVVIPQHLAEEVAHDAFAQDDFERFAIAEVQAGRSIFGLYPPDDDAQARYELWRQQAGGQAST